VCVYVVCCQADESAVSDGGEDQGAEEAFMGQEEEGEESSRQFWKEPSRASGSSFQRAQVPPALALSN